MTHESWCDCPECNSARREYIEYFVTDGTLWDASYSEEYVTDYADDMANQEQRNIRVFIHDECIYEARPE